MLPGSMKEPLVSKGETTVVKSKLWFGYLPLWQETVPLHPNGNGRMLDDGVQSELVVSSRPAFPSPQHSSPRIYLRPGRSRCH